MSNKQQLISQLLHYNKYIIEISNYNLYNADDPIDVLPFDKFAADTRGSYLNKLTYDELLKLATEFNEYVQEFNEPDTHLLEEEKHGRFYDGCSPVCLYEFVNEEFAKL